MNLPFRSQRRPRPPVTDTVDSGHHVTSDFAPSLCRFVLTCSCGDHFDTRYIDEALEYRELHERLAPLTDQLAR